MCSIYISSNITIMIHHVWHDSLELERGSVCHTILYLILPSWCSKLYYFHITSLLLCTEWHCHKLQLPESNKDIMWPCPTMLGDLVSACSRRMSLLVYMHIIWHRTYSACRLRVTHKRLRKDICTPKHGCDLTFYSCCGDANGSVKSKKSCFLTIAGSYVALQASHYNWDIHVYIWNGTESINRYQFV